MGYILRMVGHDYIDKTREYLDYIDEHIENVQRAFNFVFDACEGVTWPSGVRMGWETLQHQVEYHDLSKFSAEEFTQYRANFFPVDDEDKETSGFSGAWENHKNKNSHHHEVAKNFLDIVHMVIDWTAMGFKFGDTAQEFYEKNQERINLSSEHKEFMYEIFERIAAFNVKNQLT